MSLLPITYVLALEPIHPLIQLIYFWVGELFIRGWSSKELKLTTRLHPESMLRVLEICFQSSIRFGFEGRGTTLLSLPRSHIIDDRPISERAEFKNEKFHEKTLSLPPQILLKLTGDGIQTQRLTVWYGTVLRKETPWCESPSQLYRPSDRRVSAKWLPTFADRGCHVVSVTDPYGRILGFLDRSRYFSVK
jgi:hypothetical protein